MDIAGPPELPTAVLDSLPDPVVVKDHEGCYVWVNLAFERAFSVRRNELIGLLDDEIFEGRQSAPSTGGETEVLATGQASTVHGTLTDPDRGERRTITHTSRLTMAGHRYLVGIIHDVTDVALVSRRRDSRGSRTERPAANLNALANLDPLTGCLKMPSLLAAVDLDGAGERGVVILDLDQFKSINDRFGYGAGDAVLVHVVSVLTSAMRSTDYLARLGGEEFVAVLPNATLEQTLKVAERMCTAVAAQPAVYNGSTIECTVTIGGVHNTGESSIELGELLTRADEQLGAAKEAGQDQALVVGLS